MKIAVNLLNGEPEIFKSIQGEGRNCGKKCVFLRLKGCNLHCSWCDTRDSWDTEDVLNEGVCYKTTQEIVSIIKQYKTKHLVITGGEPLLQQRALQELVKLLPGYYIEVETNGTIIPTIRVNQFNVSPKLGNSDNKDNRINPAALKRFVEIPYSDFKFVIKDAKDITEVDNFSHLYQVDKRRIFLMPLGKTMRELRKREGIVERLAQSQGYCYTSRLHIKLFGEKRGV